MPGPVLNVIIRAPRPRERSLKSELAGLLPSGEP